MGHAKPEGSGAGDKPASSWRAHIPGAVVGVVATLGIGALLSTLGLLTKILITDPVKQDIAARLEDPLIDKIAHDVRFKGPKGDPGAPGIPGLRGRQGIEGPDGPTGPQPDITQVTNALAIHDAFLNLLAGREEIARAVAKELEKNGAVLEEMAGDPRFRGPKGDTGDPPPAGSYARVPVSWETDGTPRNIAVAELTLTTSGRPVYLGLIPAQDSPAPAYVAIQGAGNSGPAMTIERDGTVVYKQVFQGKLDLLGRRVYLPPSTFSWIDTNVPAATHTYKFSVQLDYEGDGGINPSEDTDEDYSRGQNLDLMAFELFVDD